jgi:hypothetical protein
MRRSGGLVFTLLTAAMLLAAFPLLADTTNAPAMPIPASDGFAPGLGIFAAIMVMVMAVECLLLVGFGLAAGLLVFALAGALTAFGILSSSAAIGFIRRSPASGFRALFIQLGAIAGIPCGIGAIWLVSWAADTHWSVAWRLLLGGVCGMACGVVVALLFNFVWGTTSRWMLGRFDSRRGTVPKL